MNNIIGVSTTSSCVPLIWLAGAFAVCQTLEKTHSYYLSISPSCLTATHDGSQVAVADKKQIIVLNGQKYQILTNAVVKYLFYSSKGTYLVAVEEEGICIYNRIQKLIVSIPASKVISVDFDPGEEYMITVTAETIQKWDIRALSSDDALKKYRLVKTQRIDSVIQNSKIVKAVWSNRGMRSIYAITDTGLLLVIKDNLWVDRWVDVKMNTVNSILCWENNVIVGGSYTRY
jgi:hypothetical protein